MFSPPGFAKLLISADNVHHYIVQGQMHFYRLFRSSGRIKRSSDNAELTLNWPAFSDNVRLYLHRECDSSEQLSFRTHLLIYDAVYAEYFVTGAV